MTARLNLIGKLFGRLTVIERAENQRQRTRWLCRCSCGALKAVLGSDLVGGGVLSCGCYSRQITRERRFKHGLHKTPMYIVWCGMKARCLNPKHQSYKNYGGRGITICERWKDSFANFLSDMGERPTPSHTIERVDNDKGYEPSNCCWATRKEQRQNQRENPTSAALADVRAWQAARIAR